MDTKTDQTPKDLSPFEKFVQAVFRVPKAAISEAESKRPKRVSRTAKQVDAKDS
jgi:hypothetical protein